MTATESTTSTESTASALPLASWIGRNGVELILRPLHSSDAPQILLALNRLSPATRRQRFFSTIQEFTPRMAEDLARIDPSREFGLLILRREAVSGAPAPASVTGGLFPVAGGRFSLTDPERMCCEFSLLVGDGWHGQGLGGILLDALMVEASRRGLHEMDASILADNLGMLRLARSRGFVIEPCPQEPDLRRALRHLDRPAANRSKLTDRLRQWLNQRWGDRLRDWLRLH